MDVSEQHFPPLMWAKTWTEHWAQAALACLQKIKLPHLFIYLFIYNAVFTSNSERNEAPLAQIRKYEETKTVILSHFSTAAIASSC